MVRRTIGNRTRPAPIITVYDPSLVETIRPQRIESPHMESGQLIVGCVAAPLSPKVHWWGVTIAARCLSGMNPFMRRSLPRRRGLTPYRTRTRNTALRCASPLPGILVGGMFQLSTSPRRNKDATLPFASTKTK
jgi:hypothetical protein